MSQPQSPPTVLVLDSELGFMLALSQELSKRQIACFPARTVQEAQSLLLQFRLKLDALVTHCGRPGACGFAEAVTQDRPGVPIVGIISERHRCRRCADRLAAQLRDPEDRGPERISHCADVIEMLVRGHKRRAHRAG
ncbi:MAG: hypothetical protein LAP40_09525 [Acidobacteriia bacterium]|nr:hypothetical protein [Terriglobia bacterium]